MPSTLSPLRSLPLLAEPAGPAAGGPGPQLSWMPAFARQTVVGVAIWQLLALLFTLFLAFLVRRIFVYLLREKIQSYLATSGRRWVEASSQAVDKPLGVLVMGLVFKGILPLLGLPRRLDGILEIAVGTVVNVGLVWALYRMVDVLAAYMAEKAEATETKLDDQLVPMVRKTLKVFLVLMGALFVLENLDVDVGSALAGLGIGGLAFALAAQDTIANLFGSLMIFTDRPFQIGDWVIIDKVEGTVEEVGFRSSRIRTFYNSLVTLPNSKVVNTVVDNMGMRRYRRVKETLGVVYGTTPEQIDAFTDGIRAILLAHPATRKDYYLVHFVGFGDFSLNILLYFFLDVPDWQAELRAKHQIFLEILRLAERLRVSFAFPTQTLHVESLARPGERFQVEVPSTPALVEGVKAFGPGGEASRPEGPRLTPGYYAEDQAAPVVRGPASGRGGGGSDEG